MRTSEKRVHTRAGVLDAATQAAKRSPRPTSGAKPRLAARPAPPLTAACPIGHSGGGARADRPSAPTRWAGRNEVRHREETHDANTGHRVAVLVAGLCRRPDAGAHLVRALPGGVSRRGRGRAAVENWD